MKLLNSLTCYPDSIRKPGYYPGSVLVDGKTKIINKIILKKVFDNYMITSDKLSILLLTRDKQIRIKDDMKKERTYEQFNFDEDKLISFIFENKFDFIDFESYFNLKPIPIVNHNHNYDRIHRFHNGISLMNGTERVGYVVLLSETMYEYKLNIWLTILLSGVTEVSIKYVKDNSWIIETRNYQLIDNFSLDILLNLKHDFHFDDVESLLNLKQL